MYTTPWCGYCHRLKSQLDREGITYDIVDIEQDPAAAQIVESANGGNQTVPDAGVRRRHRADQPVAGAGQGEARRAGELMGDTSGFTGRPVKPDRHAGAGRRVGRVRRTSSPAGHQEPGSGPPYQCSTRDRQIETPPGRTRVPASARCLHLGAGEPAGLLDLGAVDADVGGHRRGRRSPASGWPGAATAGCRSSSTSPTRTPTSSATSRRTASSRVSPGSQKPASVE